MTGGVLLGIFGLLFLVAVCCGYKSLKIAIDVIDASADFLACTKRIIWVPIFYFLLTIVVISMWIPSMIAILTMGITQVEVDTEKP